MASEGGKPQKLRPLAMVSSSHDDPYVVAVDSVAQTAGIRPGHVLADARALVPNLEVAKANMKVEIQALEALADWCGRYTPWVAIASTQEGKHSLWLNITGCSHLFGGERSLFKDAIKRLGVFGFASRAGIAGTPGAAWAAVHGTVIEPETDPSIHVIAPECERWALHGLPVTALRLSHDVVIKLGALGLTRIGELVLLPRAPLVARFGPELLLRLDQALGREQEPISPRRSVPCRVAQRIFSEPISELNDVSTALDLLLADLCWQLAKDYQGARSLEFALYLINGRVVRQSVGTSQPVRDPDYLKSLFAQNLLALNLEFGFDMMTLSALKVESLGVTQSQFNGVLDHCDPTNESGLSFLIDRLGNRLGLGNVVRLIPYESYDPGRVVSVLPLLVEEGKNGPGLGHFFSNATWHRSRPRPICLFIRPELVDVVALFPGGAPALFHWRRRVHRVTAVEGPERLEAEWWREGNLVSSSGTPPIRDYYCIEDIEGYRFWFFRDKVFNNRVSEEASEEKRDRPVLSTHLNCFDSKVLPLSKSASTSLVFNWFIHGLFA